MILFIQLFMPKLANASDICEYSGLRDTLKSGLPQSNRWGFSNRPLDLSTIRLIRDTLQDWVQSNHQMQSSQEYEIFLTFLNEFTEQANIYSELEWPQCLDLSFQLLRLQKTMFHPVQNQSLINQLSKNILEFLSYYVTDLKATKNFEDLSQDNLAEYMDTLNYKNHDNHSFFYPNKIQKQNPIVVWDDSLQVVIAFTGNAGFKDSLMSISDFLYGNGINKFIDLNGQANILSHSVDIIKFLSSDLKFQSYIKESIQMGKKIRFLGHGYNGALAELTAYYFHKKYYRLAVNQIQSITFGVPGYLTRVSAQKIHASMGKQQLRFRLSVDSVAQSLYPSTSNQHGIIYLITQFDEGIVGSILDKSHDLSYYRSNLLNTDMFNFIRQIFFLYSYVENLKNPQDQDKYVEHLQNLFGIINREFEQKKVICEGRKVTPCTICTLIEQSHFRLQKLENYSEYSSYHPEIKGKLEEKIIVVLENSNQEITLESNLNEVYKILYNHEKVRSLLKENHPIYDSIIKAMTRLEFFKNPFLKSLYQHIQLSTDKDKKANYKYQDLLRRFMNMSFNLNSAKLALQLGVHPEYTDTGTTGTMFLFNLQGEKIGVFKSYNKSLPGTSTTGLKQFFSSYLSQQKSLASIIDIQPKNEFIASMLAVQFDFWDIVPLSVITNLPAIKVGSLNKKSMQGVFIEMVSSMHFKTAKTQDMSLFDTNEGIHTFQKMVIWDYFTGNLDRKLENLLIRKDFASTANQDGMLYCIDNANIFPVEGPAWTNSNMYSWGKLNIATQPFLPKSKELINNLILQQPEIYDFIHSMEELFKAPIIQKDGIDFLEMRLRVLSHANLEKPFAPKNLAELKTRTQIIHFLQHL